MAATDRARLTAAAGRRFAFQVGGAFLLIGALLWWRARSSAPLFAGIGTLLVLAGLAVPDRLGPLERTWMRVGELIGRVMGPITLALIYFLVVTPAGWLRRRFGGSTLVRPDGASFWIEKAPEDDSAATRRERMRRQF